MDQYLVNENMNKINVCQLCDQKFKSKKSLSKHLVKKHLLLFDEMKEYYDQYIKDEGEGICLISKEPTRYLNFVRGYEEYSPLIIQKSSRPTQILYWTLRHNKTEEEAKRFVSETQKERSNRPRPNARKGSIRCKEYWMDKHDMTLEQANLQVSLIQLQSNKKALGNPNHGRVTLMTMTNKYGEEEGRRKYKQWRDNLKKRKRNSPSNTSSIANTLFHMLELCGFNGKWGKNEKSLFDHNLNRSWFYDFIYFDKIIEYNGEYYHPSKEKYDDNFIMLDGRSAGAWRKEYDRKIEYAEECGYIIKIIMQKDIDMDIRSTLDKCIDFLQERKNDNNK